MTPLHRIGQLLRDLLLAVPLPVAKLLFLALPAVLLLWVLFRKGDAGEEPRQTRTLKIWAAATLLLQILIYALL